MKLVQADRNIVEKYKKTKLFALIEEFIETGHDCAKIEGAAQHYKSPAVGAQVINISIKRQKRGGYKGDSKIGRNISHKGRGEG